MATEAEARPFTARLPLREYEALKAYAFVTGATLSEVVVRAVREFLAAHAGTPEVDRALEARTRYREAADQPAES